MSEPVWLPLEVIVETNEDLVRETGEPFAILNEGLLESALERARFHYFYGGVEDIVTLGTALLFGIARNHAFVQGNKRTGFIAFVMFLESNGYMLTMSNTELLGKYITLVISGGLTEDDFIEALQPYVAECGDYYDEGSE